MVKDVEPVGWHLAVNQHKVGSIPTTSTAPLIEGTRGRYAVDTERLRERGLHKSHSVTVSVTRLGIHKGMKLCSTSGSE